MFGRASFVAAMLVSAAAHAAPLVSFPFSSTEAAGYVAPNYQTSGVDAAKLPAAYIGSDGFGNVLEAYPVAGAISASTAYQDNSFFSVTVSTTDSAPLDLKSISFDVGKGGNSDPRGYAIYGSQDGFTTPLLSVQLPTGTQQAPAAAYVNLPSAYAADTTATFEFFVYTPSSTEYSVDFRDLSFNNSVVASVPEPAALAVLGIGVFALAGVTRARRRGLSV